MATRKISAMTPATLLDGDEIIPIVQAGINKTTTLDLLRKDSNLGVFNILDYGAVSGDSLSDSAAIQAAVDAAFVYAGSGATYGKGATVYVPPGTWNITARITLKSGVRVKCEPGSIFWLPDSYASSVWYSPGPLTHSGVTGGFYRCNTYDHKLLELYSGTFNDFIAYNCFRDMHMYNCDTGVHMHNASTGWLNANTFDNIYISRPRVGFNIEAGAGNLFSNCQIQSYEEGSANPTETGIHLGDCYNSFTNFNLWDWNVVPATSKTVIIDTNCYSNYVQGMINITNTNYTDNGYFNTIISDGMISMTKDLEVRTRYSDADGTYSVPAGDNGIKIGSKYYDTLSDDFTTAIMARNMAQANYGSQLIFKTHPTSTGAGLRDVMGLDYNKGVFYPPSNTGTVGTSITQAMLGRIIYYNEAAASDLSANPQIEAGRDGQIITIIGSSDTNTLTLDDGDGLALSAQCILGLSDTITLVYMSSLSLWCEISRSNN